MYNYFSKLSARDSDLTGRPQIARATASPPYAYALRWSYLPEDSTLRVYCFRGDTFPGMWAIHLPNTSWLLGHSGAL